MARIILNPKHHQFMGSLYLNQKTAILLSTALISRSPWPGIYARGASESSPIMFAILTTEANEIMVSVRCSHCFSRRNGRITGMRSCSVRTARQATHIATMSAT